MSSSFARDPMTGVIRQGNQIVGAICLPEEDCADFIESFNACYGSIRLHIEPVIGPQWPLKPHAVRPVGARAIVPPKPNQSYTTDGQE